jgi:DNA topoisomerase-2
MEMKEMKYPPGLFKIIDEVVVNAIDHWCNYPRLVKNIYIKFDKTTGQITVKNDGPGIEILKTKNIHGKVMYTVQMIAAEFLAGDNLDADESRVTGGTNGAGLKLTNAFSDKLIIETTDEKKYYRQKFSDRLETIQKPQIWPINKAPKDKRKEQTTIIFTPSYEDAFKFEGGYDEKRDGKTLHDLIITRAYHAAAYARCNVYFNDSLIDISAQTGPKSPLNKMKNFTDFVHLFYDEDSQDEIHNCIMGTTHKWNVSFGPSDGKSRSFSLINGIWVYEGGSHIKHIQDQLVAGLKTKVEKVMKKSKLKFNPNYILNNVFIFVRGAIPDPTFGGQVKAKIENPKSKFKSYELKKTDID